MGESTLNLLSESSKKKFSTETPPCPLNTAYHSALAYIGKNRLKWCLIFHAIHFSDPLGGLFGLNFGTGDHLHRTDAAISQIFDFLIFWSFLGIFVRIFGYFLKIQDKIAQKRLKNQKIKNL